MTSNLDKADAALRSYLFVPATSERKLDKAFASAADAVIVDLEDAVAVSEKPQARQTIAARLQAPAARPAFVRVNALSTPFGFDDIEAVVSPNLVGIILPKAESARDIEIADWTLTQIERRRGVPEGATRIVPIIETARGLDQATAIAAASPRLASIAFGFVDLASDMGLDLGDDDGAIQHARFVVATASRAAGLPGPVDTAFIDIKDLDRLRRSTEQARRMGYSGKCCIHPAQIDVVNAVFSPGPEEVARARRIVEAFEQAEAGGVAALMVDGVMIDYPVVARAQRVLVQAGLR
jgi:citrate lyase subunit beta/citryl-CoA lyase